MSEEKKDRDLGMRCPISRRDFLNGVAVGAGGALVGGSAACGDGRRRVRAGKGRRATIRRR